MSNWWKRGLSLLLAFVMVVGILPMSTWVKAAADNLHTADGIIWLTKEDGGASQAFIDKVYSLQLDDMIRKALGVTDKKAKVQYDGADINNPLEIGLDEAKLNALKSDLEDAVKNHELVTFTVGGVKKTIAFRSIEGAEIQVGDDNKVYVDVNNATQLADLEGLVANALNAAKVHVTHNGTVTAVGIYNEQAKAHYKAEEAEVDYNCTLPTAAEDGLKKIGEVTITIYADEIDEGEHTEEQVSTVTADVVLRDTRKIHTVTYQYHYDGASVENETFKTVLVYHGDPTPSVDASLKYYNFVAWDKAFAATVTDSVTYTATVKAQKDLDGNGLADQNQKFTITYIVEGQVYHKEENVSYGVSTPQPANPAPFNGLNFNGWKPNADGSGAFEPNVYKNITYYATWTAGPTASATAKVLGDSLKIGSLTVYSPDMGITYKVENPEMDAIIEEWADEYDCTGWYYLVAPGTGEDLNKDGVAEEKSFAIDQDLPDGVQSLELYLEFFPKLRDGEEFAVGTPNNQLHIYQFVTEDGEFWDRIQLEQNAPGVPDGMEPAYEAPLYHTFDGWDYDNAVVEVKNNGGVFVYTVKPALTLIENELSVKLPSQFEDIFDVEQSFDGEKMVITLTNDAFEDIYYQGFVQITNLSFENGVFYYTYDAANTEITVSPLWMYQDGKKTGEMGFYVKDVTVDGSSVVTGYKKYNAYKEKSPVALLSTGNGVDLKIDYAPAALEENLTPGEKLSAGQNSYSQQTVYNKAINYNLLSYADEYVTVLYKARAKGKVTIDLYKMYDALEAEGLGFLKETVQNVAGTTMTIDLMNEVWLEVDDLPAEEMTAQEVADDFFAEAIRKLKAGRFSSEAMEEFITGLMVDLPKELGEKALHKFGYTAPGYGSVGETLKITYENEKLYAEKTVDIELLDRRLPATLEVIEKEITEKYNHAVEDKVLGNVILKGNGSVMAGTLTPNRDYSTASAKVYENVTVLFKGNEMYSPAVSESFKLTVEKIVPTVTVKDLIAVMHGADYYEEAAAKVDPEAPIVHVIAGVATEELSFGKDLALDDNEIVIDVWVKLPLMYTELLDGLNLSSVPYEGVSLPNITLHLGEYYEKEKLEVYLEDYANRADAVGAASIKKVLNVLDKIPERVLTRLGLNDVTYTLRVRMDELEDEVYPTDAGFYINYAATVSSFISDNNYGVDEDYGFIVISPMVPIPNRGGVQLFDGKISNAQNIFVYEYNGEKVKHGLEVAVNGVKLDGEAPFYYGVTTRFDATTAVPTMPGIYVAGYNYTTTVYNEDTQEDEVRRLGSDSAIIIIKQQEADMNITGGIFEYDGASHLPEIVVSDKNGNPISGAGKTIISGTVNVRTDGANVSANDLFGAVNIDFPDGLTIPYLPDGTPGNLDEAWAYYREKVLHKAENGKFTPGDVIAFLEFCGEKVTNAKDKAMDRFQATGVGEAIDAALEKVNVDVTVDNGVERAQNLLDGGKAYYDKLIEELRPLTALDDNVWMTFYDLEDLDYSATGAYLYVGVITDPDLTVGAGKGMVIIHSADDYIMSDTHVPYDGESHNIFTTDNTKRGEVSIMVDRKNHEIKFYLDGDVFGAIEKALDEVLGKGLSDGSDGTVGTAYTKSEKIADKLTAAIIEQIKTKAISRIEGKHPAGSAALKEALDKLETKIDNLTLKVSGRLQELDKLPNDTRIVIYEMINDQDLKGMPVNVGTYEFYGFDFDVATTRGTLVIEPIYILVEDNAANKFVGESDPTLTATVTYYSYSGVEPNAVEKVTIAQLPAGVTEADLVTYTISRTQGETVGKYDISVKATLLEKSGNYKLAAREEDTQDFEIMPNITVEKGKWSMSLDSVIYLNHHPVITGAPEGFDLKANGGVVIWTGSEKPASGEELYVGAPNTEFKLGMQESTLEGYGLGVQSLEIFAKNVGDMVYVRPFVKVGENTYVYSEKAYGYSPARFCYDILCDLTGEDEGKREVCAALLEYAASAQNFFNYKTSNLVTDIPSSTTKPWDKIDLSSYDLAFKTEYLDSLNRDYAQELANTLTGEKVGIYRERYALDLEGAIRMSVGFNLDETLIPWADVAKAEVLFWTEEALAKAYAEDGSIAYEYGNYSSACKLLPKTGDEEVYLGEYRGKSDHILAKNLSETIYFTVRVEMEAENGEEPKVYRTGLFLYSPEQFIYDCLNDETSEYKDTVCERIAVYSQKALEYFGE